MWHAEEAATGRTCCWDAPGRLTSQRRRGTLEKERQPDRKMTERAI